VLDVSYRRMSRKSDGKCVPEYRVLYLVPGIILIYIGLVWYGWFAERGLPWATVDVGTLIFTLGSFVASQAIMAYQLDEFTEFSASANAASRVVSCVLAFVFPIFAPESKGELEYGWGKQYFGTCGPGARYASALGTMAVGSEDKRNCETQRRVRVLLRHQKLSRRP